MLVSLHPLWVRGQTRRPPIAGAFIKHECIPVKARRAARVVLTARFSKPLARSRSFVAIKRASEPARTESRALRPSGIVVLEAFRRDATKTAPIGGDTVFDPQGASPDSAQSRYRYVRNG
jgi:hypothetical protein